VPKDVTLNLRINAADAAKLDDAAGKVERLGTKFDDTGTKAGDLGQSVGSAATDASSSLADVGTAATDAGTSIDDAATTASSSLADIGTSADDVSTAVADAGTSASSSLDDIGTSADGAQASMDALANTDTSQLQTGLEGVGTSADDVSSGSMPGMGRAINKMSTQALKDIPGIGGAFGNMTPIIGRMIGTLATGPAAMSAMLGPMAAIGAGALVINKVTEEFKKGAEHAKYEADQVKELTSEMEKLGTSGDGAADAIKAAIDKAGGVKVDNVFAAKAGIKDLTAALDEAGISEDKWVGFVANGAQGLTDLTSVLSTSNLSIDKQNAILGSAIDAQKQFGTSTAQAGDWLKFHTNAADIDTAAVEKNNEATHAGADAKNYAAQQTAAFNQTLAEQQAQQAETTRETARAQQATTDLQASEAAHTASVQGETKAAYDLIAAQRALDDRELAATDTKYALEAADRAARESFEATSKTIAGHKVLTDADKDAMEGSRQAAEDAAKKYADLNSTAADGHDKVQLMIDSLTMQASTLAPGSQLRTYLDQYINTLKNDLPKELTTKIGLTIVGTTGSVIGAKGGYASGTENATPGAHPVAESGPELVLDPSVRNFRGGERVLNARQTRGLLGGASYHIEVHNHGVTGDSQVAQATANELGWLLRAS